jgi:hypothetical protein
MPRDLLLENAMCACGIAGLLLIAFCLAAIAKAQDLAPRAYIITPVHSTAVNLIWSFYDGGLNLNGAIPIRGATGTYSTPR